MWNGDGSLKTGTQSAAMVGPTRPPAGAKRNDPTPQPAPPRPGWLSSRGPGSVSGSAYPEHVAAPPTREVPGRARARGARVPDGSPARP